MFVSVGTGQAIDGGGGLFLGVSVGLALFADCQERLDFVCHSFVQLENGRLLRQLEDFHLGWLASSCWCSLLSDGWFRWALVLWVFLPKVCSAIILVWASP